MTTLLKRKTVHSNGKTTCLVLKMGRLEINNFHDDAVWYDNVTHGYYSISKFSIKKLINTLKSLNKMQLQVQRWCSVKTNEVEYVPFDQTAFLFGNMEFDWEDAEKIDKLLNPL